MEDMMIKFEVRDRREVFFFLNVAFEKSIGISSHRWGNHQEGLKEAIKRGFHEYSKNAHSFSFVDFKKMAAANFLNEESFSVLDDYNACLFLWSYVKHSQRKVVTTNRYLMTSWEKTCLKIYTVPVTREQRAECVIGYFDCLGLDISLGLDRKRLELLTAMQKWNAVEIKSKYTRWIDRENKELCEWLWRYLLQEGLVCDDIVLKDSDETYFAIMGFLSAWPDTIHSPGETGNPQAGAHIVSKEEALTRMHKAWMQKQYRKSLSSNEVKLSKSTINKLNMIERKTGVKPGVIIGDYVDELYNKLKK
ncbi:MAG: hypothetical protein E6093_08210 [Serratia liquefaciens]|nr:hypothetical protein [Serratia liquefaciens]HEJ7040992.1 hypothetical protein [Serratia liquefaciens]